jgi:hypothetical protein
MLKDVGNLTSLAVTAVIVVIGKRLLSGGRATHLRRKH